MPVFIVTFQPVPIEAKNLDDLAVLSQEAEIPPRIALIEASDDYLALMGFVSDDLARATKTGIISVVTGLEEWT